jgi:hypothetical protein
MGKDRFMALDILLLLILASPLFLGSLAQATDANAVSGTIVEVEPHASFSTVGGNFTVNVTITDVQNLYAFEVDLFWNASVLEAVGTDVRLGSAEGVLHSPFYPVENSVYEGKYVLAVTSYGSAPSFNGSGIIVGVAFNVKSQGTSSLTLETQLYDYPPPDRDPRISLPIDHSTIDGMFVSAIPEIPSPTVLFVFATLTAVTVAFSRKTPGKTRHRRLRSCLRRPRQSLLVEEKVTK